MNILSNIIRKRLFKKSKCSLFIRIPARKRAKYSILQGIFGLFGHPLSCIIVYSSSLTHHLSFSIQKAGLNHQNPAFQAELLRMFLSAGR
jgi:hypothetical protein